VSRASTLSGVVESVSVETGLPVGTIPSLVVDDVIEVSGGLTLAHVVESAVLDSCGPVGSIP